MAVSTNSKAQGATVSNAVFLNNAFVSSVQTQPANGMVQTVLASESTSIDVKPQLQQVRLVQAVAGNNGNSLGGQHQIVRIIKQTSDGNPAANGLNLKACYASPIKGGATTPVNFSVSASAKVFHPRTKLRVGDTITIPKTRLMNDKVASDLSSERHMLPVLSAPTKFVHMDSIASQTSNYDNRVIASGNVISPAHITTVHPNTPFTQQVSSPGGPSTLSPSWIHSPLPHKRPPVFADATQGPETKRRRTPTTEKGSKGLRHFAMLVCEKVKQKVTTTYNEVADELVQEYSSTQRHLAEQQLYDQKNIRRRVYDALNVLMAMDIIYKDKKDIHWVGLPTNSAQEVQTLQNEKKSREQRIQQKTLRLQELILQQIAFKNLVERNKRTEQAQGSPVENSTIQLPFIIVNTSKKTVIDCSISNDKHEYMFNFDDTFEIHDDIEVLKRMGMAYGLEAGRCSKEKLETAQSLLPPVLKPYLEQMAGYPTNSTLVGSRPTMEQTWQDISRTVPTVSSGKDTWPLVCTTPPVSDPYRSGVSESNSKSSQANLNNSTLKEEPAMLDLNSCFPPLGQVFDAEDQEVAMVTHGSQMSGNPNQIGKRLTYSRSSSSGFHSGIMTLTPMSSTAGSESRGSSPDFHQT